MVNTEHTTQLEEKAAVAGPSIAATGAESGAPSLGTRVFQNTMTLLGGRGVSVLLSGATSVLLARYLGPERMGQYGAIYAYLMLYSWLSTFGLEQILAREASRRRSEAGNIFLTGTVIASGFALAGISIALLLAPAFGYGGVRILLLLAAIDNLLLPALSLAGIVFQVDMRQWYPVAFGLFRQVLWLVCVCLLVFGKADFFWVIAGRSLTGIVGFAVTFPICLQKRFLPRPWRFSWESARTFVRYGAPIALSVVAGGIYQRIDQVMLHNMAGDRTLGPYVVAVQMAELFSALPVALMGSLFPVLAQTAEQQDVFRRYLGVSYRFLMAAVFGICAVLIPVVDPLVNLFYGKQFESSAGLLTVLIWSEAPIFFAVALGTALVASNLQRYLPLSTIMGAALNTGLNFVVIPRWGALGASWATVVSYAVAGIFMFLFFRRTRQLVLEGLRISLAPFLLALGITGVLHLLPWGFWWKLPLACVGYASGAWLTGTVRRAELDQVWSLVRRSSAYGRS